MNGWSLGKRTFTLGVSGTYRWALSTERSPYASFEIVRQSGSQDFNFKVYSSNFEPDEIQGLQGLVGERQQQMTGSAYQKYWFAEPGGSGSVTGSATDAVTPYMFHFVDVGCARLMVEISSSYGGDFTIKGYGKG